MFIHAFYLRQRSFIVSKHNKSAAA